MKTSRPGRIEIALVRMVLSSWPRRARVEDGHAVLQTFIDRRERGPLLGTGRAIANTLLECANLLWTGLELRAEARAHRNRPRESWGSRIGHVLRMGVRSSVRRPLWSLLIVAILAVGIGSSVAVFTIVDAVVIQRLPYEEPQQLLRIGATRSGRPGMGTVSGPTFRDVERTVTELESVAASTPSAIALSDGDAPAELMRGAYVSGAFFGMLGRGAAIGRTIHPADDRTEAPLVIVLGHQLWRGRFNGRAMVGERMEVEGTAATVVGIMPPDFYPPEGAHLRGMQFWLPLSHAKLPIDERGLSMLDLIGRIRRNSTRARVEAELQAIGAGIREQHGLSERAFAGFQTASLLEETTSNARNTLVLLAAAVTLLLGIGVANVAQLYLVRTLERLPELRIKSSLGARRLRLIGELVAESVYLSVLGGMLGALLAVAVVEAVTTYAPFNIPRLSEVHINTRALVFAWGLSVGIGVIVSALPALRVVGTRQTPGGPRATRSVGQARVRDALVLVQVGLGLMLMVGAGLLMRSLVNLHSVRPGLNTQDLYTVALRLDGVGGPGSDVTLLDQLLERASSLPGVSAASLTSGAPFTSGGWTVYIQPEGTEISDQELAAARIGLHQVSAGHLRHLGIPFVAGRGFLPSDGADAIPAVVISQSLAEKHWPGGDAVGRKLVVGGDGTFAQRTVLGVVRTPRYRGPAVEPEQHIWLPYAQFPPEDIDIVMTVDQPAQIGETVRRMVGDLGPRVAIRSLEAADRAVQRYFVEPTFLAAMFAGFATVALGLSCIGLYGTLRFAVESRRRELGIRLALGATPSRLSRVVLARGVTVIALGILSGLLGSRVTTNVLEAFLFQVQAGDVTAWLGACLFLMSTGLMASWLPARTAGRTPPASSLRVD